MNFNSFFVFGRSYDAKFLGSGNFQYSSIFAFFIPLLTVFSNYLSFLICGIFHIYDDAEEWLRHFFLLLCFFPYCFPRWLPYISNISVINGLPLTSTPSLLNYFLTFILIFLDHDIRILCCIENYTISQMQPQIDDRIDVSFNSSK